MNRETNLFDTLSNVDAWSQLRCLGSMQFTVTAEAIRLAMKIIPDHPTPDTIEAFLNEERNLKVDVEFANNDECAVRGQLTGVDDVIDAPGSYYEERRTLSALLALRQDFLDRADELASNVSNSSPQEERTLLNTMDWMRKQKKTDPAVFARDYNTMMKLGGKNYGQTREQYVQEQLLRQARDADVFAAKGEFAVQFLEGLDLIPGPLDDRIWDALERRCVVKLIESRMKIGMGLNYRTTPEKRAEAEADITFIEGAIEALGGTVPGEAVTPPEAPVETAPAAPIDTAALLAQLLAAMAVAAKPQDPRAPGPVTITRP